MSLAEKYLPNYTVEDYLRWEGDWELIEGIPFAMAPSPFAIHQRVSFLIANQIDTQIEDCPKECKVFLELDWIVNENTVVRPDVSVVCGKVEDFIKTTPKVIFEVVSKSTAARDEQLKFELYQREKVNYYGLVYPNLKKMRVFRLINNRYEKVFDSDRGSFRFELECPFTVDLDYLWRRI